MTTTPTTKKAQRAARTHCDKPDRDVPTLTCGYPLPCPHHTVVMTEQEMLAGAIPAAAWIQRLPMISIGHHLVTSKEPGDSIQIGVRAIAFWNSVEIWRGDRLLPITASMAMLRDAFDELTREGHLALEGVDITKKLRGKPDPNRYVFEGGILIGHVRPDGVYMCNCGRWHGRGAHNGVDGYRCLGCGHSGRIRLLGSQTESDWRIDPEAATP